MTNQTNEPNKSTALNCPRNCVTVSEIIAVMESGDMVECSGCHNFTYRNGICSCRYTSE